MALHGHGSGGAGRVQRHHRPVVETGGTKPGSLRWRLDSELPVHGRAANAYRVSSYSPHAQPGGTARNIAYRTDCGRDYHGRRMLFFWSVQLPIPCAASDGVELSDLAGPGGDCGSRPAVSGKRRRSTHGVHYGPSDLSEKPGVEGWG